MTAAGVVMRCAFLTLRLLLFLFYLYMEKAPMAKASYPLSALKLDSSGRMFCTRSHRICYTLPSDKVCD